MATVKVEEVKSPVKPRFSGIILHPTSLPGPYGIGDLGENARKFIDFLDKAGQSLWQVLPLGPTGYGDSPYQSFSAFAGQPLIISPDELVTDGLLTKSDLADAPKFSDYAVDYGTIINFKVPLLHKAYDNFSETENKKLVSAYRRFVRNEKYWLEDYAIFMALKDEHGGKSWHEWADEYQFMTPKTRRSVKISLKDEIGYYEFVQFLFYRQWSALKTYANKKGIKIVGDIPIFVSPDSADLWANKSLFKLDTKGFPSSVAGVPPDYFSATGQLWGNPLYDWAEHKKTDYVWWISRIKHQLELVDYLRIDHFRGFEAYWEIPAGEETAINGKWVKGPGASLFKAIQKALGNDLPIFAEDLGIITPPVEKLRDQFRFSGMKVLQFAFDSLEESGYLPYMIPENCIVYTGTHDNNTTVGWYLDTTDKHRDRVRRYMNCSGNNIHWDFIRTAMSTPAKYAIYPMQDLLGFGADCRMNTPGKAAGNWAWRLVEKDMNDDLAEAFCKMCELFGRDKARMEVKPVKKADTVKKETKSTADTAAKVTEAATGTAAKVTEAVENAVKQVRTKIKKEETL